jgi:hypothetical protein
LSKFTAQVVGNPSASVRTTSVGILRIVAVSGATATECSMLIAESLADVNFACGFFCESCLAV